MTLLEKLDAVLICLEKHHKERHHNFISIATILQTEHPKINFGEIKFILDKLKKDEFIDTQEIQISGYDNTEPYYNINFEGRLFNEQGGYKQQMINRHTENTRLDNIETSQRLFRRAQNALLTLVAVGTLVAAFYYGVELWKYFHFK